MFTIAILLLVFPLRYIFNFLTFPYPLEYREAAMISPAIDFSKGINPYSLQNYPDHMYLYGVFYPLVLAPFINSVEHPLLVARATNVIFLVLFLGMSYYIFRKRNASIFSSLIGVIILLNSTCYIWAMNGARPDIPGLFFAFLGFCFLLDGKPGNIQVVLCAISCVISFYFKQYLVFSSLVIAAYLWLFISKKQGYFFSAVTILLGVSSFLVIRSCFPLYYEYAVLHHIVNAKNNTEFMEDQTLIFLQFYWILCILYLISIFKKLSSFIKSDGRKIHLRVFDLNQPFLQGFAFDIFDVGIIFSVLILTFSLGKHTGNTYTYYGELLLPFLVFSAIPKIDDLLKPCLHRYLILTFILGLCVIPLIIKYSTDFASYRNAYSTFLLYADKCTNIYDATPLAAMYKIEHNMFPLYNNGQIQYSMTIIPDRDNFFGKLSAVPAELFNARLLQWNGAIESKIKNMDFDCVFSDANANQFENYKSILSIDDILADRTIDLQVPRK